MAEFNAKELEVRVLSSKQSLFLGKAKVVSSFNKVGPFDVLPMHENFITLIKDKLSIQAKSGEKKEVSFERGLMEVSDNVVRVFVGI